MDRTYRYGIILFGVNYVPGDVTEPDHVIMAETIDDVRRILTNARYGAHWRYDETGSGGRVLDTPVFGETGDGADVHVVDRGNPDFAEVLDEPGDRARHAFGWLKPEPSFRFVFGPRGGIQREVF